MEPRDPRAAITEEQVPYGWEEPTTTRAAAEGGAAGQAGPSNRSASPPPAGAPPPKRIQCVMGWSPEAQRLHLFGFHVYVRNRLILLWQRYGMQNQVQTTLGKTLCGVIVADHLKPDGNKQNLDRSDADYAIFEQFIDSSINVCARSPASSPLWRTLSAPLLQISTTATLHHLGNLIEKLLLHHPLPPLTY